MKTQWCTYLMLLALSCLMLSAAKAQWTKTNIPSNYVFTLASSGTSIFVGTLDSGVYRSTDDGTTWVEANTGLVGGGRIVNGLAVSKISIFAGTYGGVYRSRNKGVNWKRVDSGFLHSVVFAITIVETEKGDMSLLAATAGGIYLSTDDGTSWSPANSGLGSNWVWTFASTSSGSGNANIFAGTLEGGVFLSTDNGSSWEAVNIGIEPGWVPAFAVSGANIFAGSYDRGVFLSTDNGASWTSVNAGLSRYYLISLASIGSALFAGTQAYGVFYSTNSGALWLSANEGMTDAYVTALHFHEGYLFAGAISYDEISGGVWRRPLSELVVSVEDALSAAPSYLGLCQNYPNPFNPVTTITYELPQRSHVILRVYDILGREVATLLNRMEEFGQKRVTFDASDLPSGVYTYTLTAGNHRETKKMLLVR